MPSDKAPGSGLEELKVTLTYTKENWATNKEVPVNIVFSGSNMKEICAEIVAHVVGLEMNEGTEIAKDTKIKTPDGEMTFDEFVATYSK